MLWTTRIHYWKNCCALCPASRRFLWKNSLTRLWTNLSLAWNSNCTYIVFFCFKLFHLYFKWEECAPWERLHMDWLYEAEHGNILIIAHAGSGWLEAFPRTDRSTRNVVRCLRTIFSPFGIPYTVVFDNGKEFVSKDLKDWLEARGCKTIDTPLYSPRSNGLAERAV